MTLVDSAGHTRATLTTDAEGVALLLLDSNGVARVEMRLDDTEGPGLWFRDEQGTGRIGAGIGEYGPAIGLCDPAGTDRVWMRSGADGHVMAVADSTGRLRAGLAFGDVQREAAITAIGEDGSVTVTLNVRGDVPGIAVEAFGSRLFDEP